MTDRCRATYRRCVITEQPHSDNKAALRRPVPLTPAETRVLALLPTYRTLADIGVQLGVGRPTVKTHVENIYRKLGATTRAEAVTLAQSAGFLPHP